MIASLYQSGLSSADGTELTASMRTLWWGTSMAIDAQDVSLTDVGIEPHVVPLAPPLVLHIVQQIVDGEDVVCGDAGHANVPVLHVIRIQVDDRQQTIGAARRGLAVGDDLGVVGVVKAKRVIELQRAMPAANRVDAAHQLANVAGPVPVPAATLILL